MALIGLTLKSTDTDFLTNFFTCFLLPLCEAVQNSSYSLLIVPKSGAGEVKNLENLEDTYIVLHGEF